MKPYAEYIDSGVPWLGKIPAHWRAEKIKWLSDNIIESVNHRGGGQLHIALENVEGWTGRLLLNDEQRDFSSQVKQFKSGDVLFGKLRPYLAKVAQPRLDGVCVGEFLVLRPQVLRVNSNFFAISLRSGSIIDYISGATHGAKMPRAEWPLIGSTALALPPLDEQAAIVKYLAHVDRMINRFIRAKRRMIELLSEQKQALIHQAVTKGLDPDAPMKDSGVEWLGEIPAHWEVRKVKDVSRIKRGKFSHRPRNDPDFYDGPFPFVQTGDVATSKKYITSYSQTLNERGIGVSKMFWQGTLLMTIAANIGDVSILGFDSYLPDSIVAIKPTKEMHSDYLYFSLKDLKSEFVRLAPVNTQGNLNVARIGGVTLAIPPLTEQQAIVSWIEDENSQTDSAIDRTVSQIELIREYRTRLVSDMVTGKVDVRATAAGLPEIEDGDAGDDEGNHPSAALRTGSGLPGLEEVKGEVPVEVEPDGEVPC